MAVAVERRPVVSATEHNAVLKAANDRVDKLEPRLASIIEVILDRAGKTAARRLEETATRNLVSAAANADVAKTATMIALKPRPDEAAALADPNGDPPEILHVTLAYLGDSDQPLSEIADALKPVAATYAPLSGVVGGVGAFHPAGVGIVLPDARGLAETRQAVVQALHDNDIDYGRDHGFTPHITINGDGDPPDESLGGQPLHFDSLHIVRGNDEEIELPLVGVRALTAAGPSWSPPFPDQLIDVDALVKLILAKTDPVRRALIEETMTPALKQAGLSFDVSNPLTAQMLARSADQVTNIALTTRANLMKIIGAAVQNGLTIPQTASLIRSGMAASSKVRATMIARTELGRAVNGGSLAATQLVSNVTGQPYNKVWRTAPGARYPRHEDYEGLDGQTRAMNETFTVGEDQLQFPGDPDGDPGEVINCRCTLTYEEAEADRVPAAAPTNDEVTAEAAGEEAAVPQVVLPTEAPQVVTASVQEAAKALADGKTVQLTQTSTVNTFIDRLGKLAAEAQKAGKSAPDLDMAKVSVKGTNLFAQDSLGVPRVQMPQLTGIPVPGSPASKLPGTIFEGQPSPWRDITQQFLQSLRDQGVQVQDETVNPESLKATQDQLNGPKIASEMDKLEQGIDISGGDRITISSDNYILDGHHRWAAYVGRDYLTGVDVPEPIAVTRIDEPITTILQQANDYAEKMGIPPQSAFTAAKPEVVAPAAEAEPVVTTPSVPADFERSVDIGITPFRAGEDNAVGFYDSPRYQQFVKDVNESAQAYGVKIDGLDHVTGVWKGDTEPSVSLRIHAENAVAHTTPPPIDFLGDVPEDVRARVTDSVNEAYARMDQAGVLQDWAVRTSEAKGAPPKLIEVVMGKKDDPGALYKPITDSILVNAGSSLFPAETFVEDAATIVKGGIPDFLNKDLADTIIHEYGHAVEGAVGRTGQDEWDQAWDKLRRENIAVLSEDKQGLFPSKYAENSSQEAWGETFVGLVNGFPQGAPFQEAMRPLLIRAKVMPKPEETPAYRIQHRAPTRENGSPMYDVTSGPGGYPPDFYNEKTQMQFYGQPHSVPAVPGGFDLGALDQSVFDTVDKVHGDPTSMVTIYRAVPGNVTTINPGDWVTPSKEYAELNTHSLGVDAESPHVISMQVPASQIFTDGNSIAEWGWDPPARTAFDADARFRAFAANLGKAYNQDGVLLFSPKADGDAFMATFHSTLPETKVAAALKTVGISGGRFTTDGRLQVIGTGKDFAQQLVKLGHELGDRYDVARGTFNLMERDSGDYQEALDAFAHPKGPEPVTVPAKVPPPPVETPHGDAILDTTPEIRAKKMSKAEYRPGNDIVNQPAQKEWLDGLEKHEINGEEVKYDPTKDIEQWGQDGSKDINAILSGHKPYLDQYGSEFEAAQAAQRMLDIVRSAPPLPPGTTLYRSILPTGLDHNLADTLQKIERDVLDEMAGPSPASLGMRLALAEDKKKIEAEIAKRQTKAIADWTQHRYPVGSYVHMGAPGALESMTTSADVASVFASGNDTGLVFRIVDAKTGAPIWPYTDLSEREVLAPPGVSYRVRSIEIRPMQERVESSFTDLGKTKDNVVVTVEEVPQPTVGPSFDRPPGGVAQYVPDGLTTPPNPYIADSMFPGQDESAAEHAARVRDAAIDRYAAANNMSSEEYKSAADEVIKSYIAAHPQIRVRVSGDTLQKILADGRFKTEFELPGVPAAATESRAAAEERLFGYPVNLTPAQRPVYGYLSGTANERGIVSEYGDFIVNLDPAVNSRATFTIGDSFRPALRDDLSPSLLAAPGLGSWDGSFDIVKAYREGNIEAITRYVEVEVHGGLAASEIGAVQPDYAVIRERAQAELVKEAVEHATELAANYAGTSLESQQTEQAGVPTEQPQSLDFASTLRDIAKKAGQSDDYVRAILSEVGLSLRTVDSLAGVDEALAKAALT